MHPRLDTFRDVVDVPLVNSKKDNQQRKTVGCLSSGERHQSPFTGSKGKNEERDDRLGHDSNTLGSHSDVQLEFVLGSNVERFREEFQDGRDGVNGDAEMEMGL